jgi:hypothetical protein
LGADARQLAGLCREGMRGAQVVLQVRDGVASECRRGRSLTALDLNLCLQQLRLADGRRRGRVERFGARSLHGELHVIGL